MADTKTIEYPNESGGPDLIHWVSESETEAVARQLHSNLSDLLARLTTLDERHVDHAVGWTRPVESNLAALLTQPISKESEENLVREIYSLRWIIEELDRIVDEQSVGLIKSIYSLSIDSVDQIAEFNLRK